MDVVALSHAHEDHIGGLPALVSDFRPKELWTGATPDSPSWRDLRAAAVRQRARIRPLTAPGSFSFGGATIDVLAPLPDYLPVDTPKNNDSLVLRVRYGRHAFLLCGDVERQIEWGMLDAGESARADVLKVAHHGSRTSSTEEFLSAVAPTFAIVSAGFENSYGHPNPDVLDRLERHRAVILRTDLDGLITIRSDGRRLAVGMYNGFLGGLSASIAVHHTRAFCRTVRSCRQPMRFRAANTRRALAEGQELMPRCRKRYSRNRPATHRERSCREQSRARPIVRAQSRPVWNRRKEAHSILVLRRSIGHLPLGRRSIVSLTTKAPPRKVDVTVSSSATCSSDSPAGPHPARRSRSKSKYRSGNSSHPNTPCETTRQARHGNNSFTYSSVKTSAVAVGPVRHPAGDHFHARRRAPSVRRS